ncbi:amino acid-binding protein [Desulfovibrio sp. OttesenSCG-928-M14]|nr:amino acid-binding protein [Desulfovibrio sp. OttesenSCG-928-M14]MDL2290732.1 amino acid-binding protein [Desulfovibrio sp. OttesenSCG-928-F20]
MSADFVRIIHSTVLESAIPAKVLAKKIGKPYSTLLREINPYDQGAKLGVETFLDILKHTGDISAVEYIANELGFDLVPRQLRKTG